MASFDNKKELRFLITLGQGGFGSSSNNQITLEGYRAIVDIDRGGGMMAGTLRAQIYGVSQSDMNSCVTYPYQPQRFSAGYVFSTIQVFAIDGDQESLVFTGNIQTAWGNYQNQPDVFLEIVAQSLYAQQLTPVAPTSFNGAFDVAAAAKQMAASLGLTFENNGVSVQLKDKYFAGTTLDQVKALKNMANVDLYIDPPVLAITPPNTARGQTGAPLISAKTGMIGYPTFNSQGITVRTLFNPAVKFGGTVQIQSDIPNAMGTFIVRGLAYKLESEKPGGVWFATILATNGNFAIYGAG